MHSPIEATCADRGYSVARLCLVLIGFKGCVPLQKRFCSSCHVGLNRKKCGLTVVLERGIKVGSMPFAVNFCLEFGIVMNLHVVIF